MYSRFVSETNLFEEMELCKPAEHILKVFVFKLELWPLFEGNFEMLLSEN